MSEEIQIRIASFIVGVLYSGLLLIPRIRRALEDTHITIIGKNGATKEPNSMKRFDGDRVDYSKLKLGRRK
tara:strand:- start:583 stop:795 length:213 start_codon:yes stop_codon:yes gene_type:complete